MYVRTCVLGMGDNDILVCNYCEAKYHDYCLNYICLQTYQTVYKCAKTCQDKYQIIPILHGYCFSQLLLLRT